MESFVLWVTKSGADVGRLYIVEREDDRWAVDFDEDFPAEDLLAIQDVFDGSDAFDVTMGLTGSDGPNPVVARAGEDSLLRFVDELETYGYAAVRYDVDGDD